VICIHGDRLTFSHSFIQLKSQYQDLPVFDFILVLAKMSEAVAQLDVFANDENERTFSRI